MFIVCGNTRKGGTGKSTLATNLAVGLHRQNYKVRVLDLDYDNTASKDFFDSRKNNDIECQVINNRTELINSLETDADITVIDIAGLKSDLTTAGVSIADILFIPFRMSPKDLKAIGNFIEDLEGKVKSYLVPNFTKAQTNTLNIRNDLASLKEVGYPIGSILTDRQSYIDSAYKGESVTEYGDLKAGAEIHALVEISMKHLNHTKKDNN